jgi:hypothetical protein
MSDRLEPTSMTNGRRWGQGVRARGSLIVAALLSCAFADAPVDGPFERAFPFDPLPPPLVVTGGFCEFRIGHFHAGLDLGTKQRVGMKVLAPAAGWVERVRASGVGYGRSVYLHTDDGRLVQLGHLDAFVEPLASYVRAKQDSSGQYEQDLWPEKNQFRFRAGQQLAWSGQSGAGGPHLHVEIRRGDMAYHPLRAGMTAADSAAPSLVDVTFEPLDEQSFVEGSAAPRTIRLGAKPDTVRAIGRLRAIVGARDGVWHGVDRMVPWSVGMEWEGREVEARFDSVSWATDMPEGEYVFDAGRVVGQKGLVLWAPAGFRPRVLRTSAPESEEAGTILIRRGDAPRRLTLWARDLAGHRAERVVVLTPWAGGVDTTGAVPAPAPDAESALDMESLPDNRLRVTVRSFGSHFPATRILVGGMDRIVPGSRSARGLTAIVSLPRPSGPDPWWAVVGGQGKSFTNGATFRVAEVTPRDSTAFEAQPYRVRIPAGAVFEPVLLLGNGDGSPPPSRGELLAGSQPLRLEPASLPLRRAIRVGHPGGAGMRRQTAFYRLSDDGWEWVGGSYDSVRQEFSASTRRLGIFNLMVDTLAPRISVKRPARRAPKTPYPTWGVEATVTENGSGLDARASRLVIDGKPVPTEWDSEERVLRWRPARMPRKGTRRVEVVATDRAGNVGRTSGTFVLD